MTNLMKLSVIALLTGTLALVGCGDDDGGTGGTGATGGAGGAGGGTGGAGGGVDDPLADACMAATGTPVEGDQYVTCAVDVDLGGTTLEINPSLPVQVKIVPISDIIAGAMGAACYASAVVLDVGIPDVEAEIVSGESVVAVTGIVDVTSISVPIPTGTFTLPAVLVFPEQTLTGTVDDVTEITVNIESVDVTASVLSLPVNIPCIPGWCGEGVDCERDAQGAPVTTVANTPISIPVSGAGGAGGSGGAGGAGGGG